MKKVLMIMLFGILMVSLLGCEKEEEGLPDLPVNDEQDWGLELTVKDVTKSGATIVFEQSGGNPSGELETGSDYRVLVYKNDAWSPVSYIVDSENLAWDALAYIITKDGVTEMEEDWSYLYGELPKGIYAIEKEVMDFRGSGNYSTALYYAIFEIE